MKKFIIATFATLGLVACASQKNEQKILVLYYSQTGTTESVAKEIQKQLGADIAKIDLENPYDGDFNATIARCQEEMKTSKFPALKPLNINVKDYDIVMLGYPIWFGTYARPIASLVQEQKFEGKKVVTFCTFGSGGLQTSTSDLKAALPNAEIVEGYGVRTARIGSIEEELNRFLIEGGYKDGEIEPLPPFGKHETVSPEDIQVFNEACGDYQFPLGTPVDVAKRQTPIGTEFEFTVKSQDMNRKESKATIYVTKTKKQGAKAEFTQVVR